MMIQSPQKALAVYFLLPPVLYGTTISIFLPYYISFPGSSLAALFFTTLLALYGFRRNSLSFDGAMYSFIVGHTLAFANASFFFCLITFFLTSSRLTKYKSRKKFERLGDEHTVGGKRNYLQVLCNGGVATIFAMGYILLGGRGIFIEEEVPIVYGDYLSKLLPSKVTPTLFEFGVIASLASACGDTWASEIGSAIGGKPRLIINPFRVVEIGTNGGVTVIGTLASFCGGLVIGIAYSFATIVALICKHQGLPATLNLQMMTSVGMLILKFGAIGFFGSLMDSIIGSIFQFSGIHEKTKMVSEIKSECEIRISGYNILDNNMVNLVSIAIVTLLYCVVSLFFGVF